MQIKRDTPVVKTARVLQMSSLFDVELTERSHEEWNVVLDLPDEWNIGLIVGPSGSGKTTIATELFGEYMTDDWQWDKDKSVLDGFPADMPIKDIVHLLSSVGFSSPPHWMRPFHILSNGEQFRVHIARTLAENRAISVVDEFTSVVDRTVAQIGSAAIARTVRKRNQKFIAVSCHYDIIEWLTPDWVYEPATGQFHSGRYLQRPQLNLAVRRVHKDAWQIFRKYHYLDANINPTATCFCGFIDNMPVAFVAVMHFPHPSSKMIKREHRIVCLPDYQGIGIGNAMSDYISSMFKGLGYRLLSIASHPTVIRHRAASPLWKMTTKPNNKSKTIPTVGKWLGQSSGFSTRMRATFEYVGPAMPKLEAENIYNRV